tara:strand:- start:1537 stop:2091 length:555 start_codon:yes stop_codon:yes gene_type:complete
MKKFFLFFFIFYLILTTKILANFKTNIIQNLENIDNFSFNFEQNINGKLQNGKCTIEYPKKIFCSYDLSNKKVLVSNGNSFVIKTLNSYYIYPIEKTPLNLILNKKYILSKIKNLEERIIDDKLINYKFFENENEINLFFDKKTFNLIGWQTMDIYQNLSITYLNSIVKNRKLKKNLFKLPLRN